MNDQLTKEQFIAKMESLTEQELLMVATASNCFVCGYALLNKKFDAAYDHTMRSLEKMNEDMAKVFEFGAKTHYVNK